MLALILGAIFYTASLDSPAWKKFYKVAPMILLCYFVPSVLPMTGIVSLEESKLYDVAKGYLLPAALILLTISIDIPAIIGLGPKALIMFLTGTLGVVIGGPIAILLVSAVAPEWLQTGDGEAWRGLATVAGSWIGGGANQVAMKEMFNPSGDLFTTMVTVDVLVAEFWMLFLLLGVDRADAIDRFLKADSSSIEALKQKMVDLAEKRNRIPSSVDFMVMLAIAFGGTGVCKWFASHLATWIQNEAPQLAKFSLDSSLFWLVVLSTTLGVGLSFTRVKHYEGAGASKIATVFIFILVATIGLKMDILAIRKHLGLFSVGLIWMIIHVGLMFAVAKLIRAPYFFLAVGSKANIGGAASAPVVAAAFHPSLTPVAVLLSVLGYALGTYLAYLCAIGMQWASGAM
ncbi:MAG: DUF819 family protein [Planctomycetota bacterium]